jgi:hypothetical protein
VLKDESSTGFARHFFRSLFISSVALSEVKVQIEKLKLKAPLRFCSTRPQLLSVITLGSKNVGKLADSASLFGFLQRIVFAFHRSRHCSCANNSSLSIEASAAAVALGIFVAARFKSAENRLTEVDDIHGDRRQSGENRANETCPLWPAREREARTY